MREAFAVAATGRPGPVLIDFLKNVTAPNVLIDYEPMERKEHIRHGRLQQLTRRIGWDIKTPEPNHDDVRKLAEMISEAEKPLLICGGGVVRGRAHEKFRALAERIDAPVAITVMGAGGFPGGHPLTTGMIGMHGSQASNIACDNCDLLIAVGCRFSDRVALDPESFASQAKIVQIDIDRAEIDKNVKTDHHIIGDANRVLELLNEIVSEKKNQRWKDFVFSYKTRTEYEDKPGELTPQQVLETIRNHVPGDSIVATDVGQHQMWTIQHFHFDYPGQLLTSGGFGTMGFGLGAALGAKLGNPDKTVLHITGDGCFRMNGQELATESHYDIPVITFVFDNRTLGMVRQWQNLIYGKRFSQTDLGFAPDFVKLAEAYGLKGKRVTNVQELEEAIEEAKEWGHGYVVDCVIDTDEMVRPMVGGGQPITNFMLI
jgi:acetolactate synthase-1/2/3 large subunit